MHFKLCYKSYDYALTNEVFTDFKSEFGRCPRNVLREIWYTAKSYSDDYFKMLLEASKVFDQTDTAWFLWRLAKTKNSLVQLSEIQDGVARTARLSQEGADEYSQHFTHIMIQIALDDEKYLGEQFAKAKKDSGRFEEQQSLSDL